MPTPDRWREDYDPGYDLLDRYDPSDDREPPDDAEPEDNVPDAVADRLSWDFDDQRDYAEEAYLRNFCPACGTSPCESTDDHADLDD